MSGHEIANLTPKQIVDELDRFIIGQEDAKKAVAVALRNRWRRAQIKDPVLQKEITPRNILMSGPTGVGKTEIARRLAQISSSPFIKVEATKFTEVGYVGRDVESMIKDLVKQAINETKRMEAEKVRKKAEKLAKQIVLTLLNVPDPEKISPQTEDYETKYKRQIEYRDKMLKKLEKGELNEKKVSITVKSNNLPVFEFSGGSGAEDIDISVKDMMGNLFPGSKKEKKMTVPEALDHIVKTESEKMLDQEKIIRSALIWAQNAGIVFIDEIDKVIAKSSSRGPDISREGVQRDILPIVEGCTVNTKYGPVNTDHILFIAAGAFHMTSPNDLIPELQGRFPLQAELRPLSKDDFVKILTETENSLIIQYCELLKSDGVTLKFTPSGIDEIAEIACMLNNTAQDIGARRLQTAMEKLLEEISFNAPLSSRKSFKIDRKHVKKWFKTSKNNENLGNYIL